MWQWCEDFLFLFLFIFLFLFLYSSFSSSSSFSSYTFSKKRLEVQKVTQSTCWTPLTTSTRSTISTTSPRKKCQIDFNCRQLKSLAVFCLGNSLFKLNSKESVAFVWGVYTQIGTEHSTPVSCTAYRAAQGAGERAYTPTYPQSEAPTAPKREKKKDHENRCVHQ